MNYLPYIRTLFYSLHTLRNTIFSTGLFVDEAIDSSRPEKRGALEDVYEQRVRVGGLEGDLKGERRGLRSPPEGGEFGKSTQWVAKP